MEAETSGKGDYSGGGYLRIYLAGTGNSGVKESFSFSFFRLGSEEWEQKLNRLYRYL